MASDILAQQTLNSWNQLVQLPSVAILLSVFAVRATSRKLPHRGFCSNVLRCRRAAGLTSGPHEIQKSFRNSFSQNACGGCCGSFLRLPNSLFSVCLTWNLGLLCLAQAERRGYDLVYFFDLEFVLSSRPSKALAGRCGWLRSQIGMAFATCSRFGSNHIHELRCIKPAWVTQPQCP